jgi:hypothetical protein
MSATCRRQNQAQFEALGFRLEFEQSPDCPILEMVDDEANYAHSGDMPTDIPYLAWHGAGCNYGDGKIACDGVEFAEVGANNDGFVVGWDQHTNRPSRSSIESVRHYLAVHHRVQKLFQGLSRHATNRPQPATK